MNKENKEIRKIDNAKLKKLLCIAISIQILIMLMLFNILSIVNKNYKMSRNQVIQIQVDYDRIEQMLQDNKVDYDLIKDIVKKEVIRKGVIIIPEEHEEAPEVEVPEDENENNEKETIGDKVDKATDFLSEQFKKLIKSANDKLNEPNN